MSGFSGYMPVSVNSIVFTVPSGQWSGSGSDYYFTVQAPNVTTDSMLDVCYDNASKSLFSGTSLWVVASNGSFTVHVDSVPAGDVTIKVRLEGVVGEAQYQVLSDVYSKSQTYSKSEVYTKTETNSAISQSTAIASGESGFSAASGITASDVYLKRSGKVCAFKCTLTISGTVAGYNAVIATLPTGFRPGANTVIYVYSTYGGNNVLAPFLINSAGEVKTTMGSSTFSGSVRIDTAFMTA